jgi:3-methyl-2-oxobutanoate hydroxymethyltransferase
MELVTPSVAAEVTAALKIPVIGIGCGPNCDGQILVTQDLLGMNLTFQPKFLKHYAKLETSILDALNTYTEDVQRGVFP